MGAHGHPFGQLVAVGEERGAVGSSVEHVELVGELVVYHVMSLLGVARTVEDGVPHEYHRTLSEGLTQEWDRSRDRAVHTLEYTGVVLRRHYRRWVYEDRFNVAIVVMGESQLKQTRLCRNGDADLVGEVEAATPLPMLLLQEDLHHRTQLGALDGIEHAVVGHVHAHEVLPFGREQTLSRFGAAMVAKPVEHGRRPPSGLLSLLFRRDCNDCLHVAPGIEITDDLERSRFQRLLQFAKDHVCNLLVGNMLVAE